MNISDLFERQLQALSARLQSPLSWDMNSECVLLFDGEVEVVITALAENAWLHLRAPVVPLHDRGDEALLRRALTLNYDRLGPGQALAVDEGRSQLCLVALFDAQLLADDLFVSSVLDMAARTAELRGELH